MKINSSLIEGKIHKDRIVWRSKVEGAPTKWNVLVLHPVDILEAKTLNEQADPALWDFIANLTNPN